MHAFRVGAWQVQHGVNQYSDYYRRRRFDILKVVFAVLPSPSRCWRPPPS